MSKKHENNCKRLPKWSRNRCQNTSKINARTGIKKIKKIIKNHVSLKSEIIEIHWKNNGFWWFRTLHVRTVKVSKKHQKWDQIPSEIQWKIDTKNMLEKKEPTYENVSKTWSKNGAKIHQKSFQNRCEKRDKKEDLKPCRARSAEEAVAHRSARGRYHRACLGPVWVPCLHLPFCTHPALAFLHFPFALHFLHSTLHSPLIRLS